MIDCRERQGEVGQADFDKLSPMLAAALHDFAAGGRRVLATHTRDVGLVSTESAAKPPRVVVFVHCDDDADLTGVAGAAVELNQDGGRLRTGIVDLSALDALTDNAGVRMVVPARRLRPLMDVATVKAGVAAFRKASKLSGKGVVIGTVDTGIEADHPAFAGRILRVWDQTLHGSGVAEGRYGVELVGPMTDISVDTIGHGTHVAGIAAGVDPLYGGVAQGAELVIVKSDLLTAHIADGVRYIFRVAAELGLPAVVNLSLGGHGDAHDGTDSLSLLIDSLSGPGRIVCCAAGNEGNDNIHAQVEMRKGGSRTIAAAIPRPAGMQPSVAAFNGWYKGTDRFSVSVVSPSHQATPAQAVLIGQNPVREYQLEEGAVRITTPGPDPVNGDVNFLVQIAPAPAAGPGIAPDPPGPWRLKLEATKVSGPGRVDVWSIDGGAAQFTGAAVSDTMKVGSPGASSAAITVASYTTKSEWEDMLGNPHGTGLDLDTISEFSSEGPRRDGVEKPDLAAPGAMIGSALSGQSGVAPDMLLDALNRINAGTSMACPFIAGVVALLLERNPKLEPETAKLALREASRIPRKAKGTFDPKWGYGFISVKGLKAP